MDKLSWITTSTRNQIEEDYQQALEYFGSLKEEIDQKIEKLDELTGLFMKYLYAYMTLSDVSDYPFDCFLGYAEHAVELLEHPMFQMEIPEEYFFEYILAHRINSEDITDCRGFFYQLVCKRIQGMEPEQAVLELNNWCYEQATYRSTSARTASPMTVYKGGFGRCGEESTFLVTVLRSVGLPARQIYVPRWSHSDSNHAWVEVWINGSWLFTGACEPKPIMNNGWFSYAASRAMLVHSRLFSKLPHPMEEVSQQDGTVAELNLTNRYAIGRQILVTVTKNKKPAAGAVLRFEIINSSEFFPIAIVKADEFGKAQIRLGKGDIYITASLGDWLAHVFVNVATTDEVVMELENQPEKTEWQSFRLTPPDSARVNETDMTPEQENYQNAKNKKGDEIREKRQKGYLEEAYIATFQEYPKIQEVLRLSRGNFGEIKSFLEADVPEIGLREKELLLSTISQKDCRDITAMVLKDHLSAFEYEKNYDTEVFEDALLCPRIFLERSTAYRSYLKWKLADWRDEFVNNPENIWNYIQSSITYIPEKEYTTIYTTPCGILNTGKGTLDSQRILFIAICRSFGIPARFDWVLGTPQYYKDGTFVYVEKQFEPVSELMIQHMDDTEAQYEQNFTLGWYCGAGGYETLGLWGQRFENGVLNCKLPAGDYRLLTCDRGNSGSISGKMLYFSLEAGTTKRIELVSAKAELKELVVESELPELTLSLLQSGQAKLSDITQGGAHQKNILIFADPGKEPTEHIFNELLEINKNTGFPNSGLHLIVSSVKACEDETFIKIRTTFPNSVVYVDEFQENLSMIGVATETDVSKLPVVILTDKENHSIYSCCGYRVGTGDILARLCK